jgi:hypothetical protein
MNQNQPLRNALYLLAFIKLVLPFLLQNSFYQPHRDEYLYLTEGHHLAWGFMEVPPGISLLAWITNLFGGSSFWIKIWPSLFGAFTFLLVGKTILSLGGRIFALILGWLPFVVDGYMRLFFLFMPNFLDVFFWTLMSYAIFRHIQTLQNKWLYFFGISAGLGMMSKYSVAFFAISLLVGVLLTKHRKIFFNKHFFYASFIGVVIFLPNIFWQYNHRFPVIHHMMELQDEQLKYNSAIGFIISQLLMNLPCVFIWIAGLFFITRSEKGKPYKAFAWAYFFVIILLIVLRGKDYYALGAYPILFAFGAFYLEQLTSFYFKWTRYAMMIFSLASGIFLLPLILPIAKPEALAKYYKATGLNKTGFFKWEDLKFHPLPQDFGDMMGWKELAEKTGSAYNGLSPDQKEKTFIYCRGYFSAAALNYYRNTSKLPEVYSDNASFLFWLPDKYNINTLILVAHHFPEKDDIVFQQFGKVTIKDSMDMPLFRENGMKIILFENGNDSLNSIIERGVAKLKSQFMR